MPTIEQTEHDNEEQKGPSREEIETLCILYAVGTNGCNERELVTRLGLSHTLTSAVIESIQPLLVANRVVLDEGRIACTDAGHQWLRERLAKHRIYE